MSHNPQSVLLPSAAAPTYVPPQPGQQRPRSEWDPRSAPGTYFLVTVNVAVYLWMVLHGVSSTLPTPNQLMHYGANNTVSVLNGEWYRLLTAIFVHVGIIHIASNMWCLWNLGLLGEPLIGPFGLVAVYLLTGVAGNLLTMAFDITLSHLANLPLDRVAGVGAGASGAVFGIAGILIVLLSNRRLPIPWSELKRLRRSVVQFSGINLVLGLSTMLPSVATYAHVRVDNSAHLGGFFAGLALGPALVPRMTAGRTRYLRRQRYVFLAAAILLSAIGYGITNYR